MDNILQTITKNGKRSDYDGDVYSISCDDIDIDYRIVVVEFTEEPGVYYIVKYRRDDLLERFVDIDTLNNMILLENRRIHCTDNDV